MVEQSSRIMSVQLPSIKKNPVQRSRILLESAGKNFPSYLEEAHQDCTSKEDTGAAQDRGPENNDEAYRGGATQVAAYSTLQNVVETMGLSYFFVLQKALPTGVSAQPVKAEDATLTMEAREASHLLATLGFSSDEIASLFAKAGEDGRISLDTILQHLAQHPLSEATCAATASGDLLNTLISSLLPLNGQSLSADLPPTQRFSTNDVREMLTYLKNTLGETRGELVNSTLQTSPEVVLSDEISSYQGSGGENDTAALLRDLADTFAKEQVQNKPTHPMMDFPTSQGFTAVTLNTYGYDVEGEGNLAHWGGEGEGDGVTVSLGAVQKTDELGGEESSGNFSQSYAHQHTSTGRGGESLPTTSSVGTASAGETFSSALSQSANPSPPATQILSSLSLTPQLAAYIQKMSQQGQYQITLQLEPKELGHIVVRLRATNNRISTSISAEKEETRELLQKHGDSLRNYLADHGLALEEFTVETGGSDERAPQGDRQQTFFHEHTISDTAVLSRSERTAPVPGNYLIYFYA